MSSADFAAAQRRIAERRRAREAALQSAASAQRAARDARLSHLPYPLRGLGSAGLTAWQALNSRDGTSPAFRVGQVDAELLDEELLELLKAQIGEGLKHFRAHYQDDYTAEILLVLRCILYKFSLWDHNASYGASLQGLRYADARSDSLIYSPPKAWQKGLYGLLSVGGRYGWSKWEHYLLSESEEHPYETPTRLQILNKLTSMLSTTYSVAALSSFLHFLVTGRYRSLLDRILRMRLTPSSHAVNRQVSFEYLNRQLVWHAFTEFLLFLLPLVGINRWRRLLSRSWRRIKLFLRQLIRGQSGGAQGSEEDDDLSKSGELGFLPERTCAICYKDQNPLVVDGATAGQDGVAITSTLGGGIVGSAATDITNPYEAVPCGDVYCYVCLVQRIDAEEGEGWTCLRCGEPVKQCRPWSGGLLEEHVSNQSGSSTFEEGHDNDKSNGAVFYNETIDNQTFDEKFAEHHVDDEEAESTGLRGIEPRPEEDDDADEDEDGSSYKRST